MKAAKAEMSNVSVVHCLNHIFQAMRLWLRKHGAPSQDIAVYSEDVFNLFHSVSVEQYEQQLVVVSQKWDGAFEHYTIAKRSILMSPLLSDMGVGHIYIPYSGVTNNQSEGLNRVIKDLQGWKEAPVDCVMLAVYQLQAYYLNKIRRGSTTSSQISRRCPVPGFRNDLRHAVKFFLQLTRQLQGIQGQML